MKKIILFAIVLMSGFLAKGQDYPGKQVELLLDKELKVREIDPVMQEHGYRDFLTTPEVTYKNIYKSDKNERTPYNELVGKVFKVTQIIPYKDEFMLKLENAETGTLYYKYSTQFAVGFDFDVIGGLPTEFYCGKIESRGNGAEMKLYSPPIKGVYLIRSTLQNKPNYMIYALVWADKAEVNKKGMILTLANGKTIVKPVAEVDVAATSEKFKYTSLSNLTKEDLKLLSESPIVRIKLGPFSQDFSDLGNLSQYAKCLLR